ncbi:DEAD-box ATP-dependent RNA helicase 15-like [Lolium perenne]|uniref:DEAD-box ATP-dependent RNA helicase 15-like n=1 Tax=Lolium perenne TaxID=4522 RepID=UPI003A98E760
METASAKFFFAPAALRSAPPSPGCVLDVYSDQARAEPGTIKCWDWEEGEFKNNSLLNSRTSALRCGNTCKVLSLAREKDLPLKNARHFILDGCDKMLESL